MIVTYSPDGQDEPQVWQWDPDRVMAAEAMVIERKAECRWDEFKEHVKFGSITHRQVLLWHLLKHDHPTLKLQDVTFRAGELEVEMDAAELRDLQDNVERADTMEENQRAKVLAAIDLQLTKIEAKAVLAEGKAPSSDGTSATG